MNRRLVVLFLISVFPVAAVSDTCNDPQVINEWEQITQSHIASDEWQRFHAVWLGLCEKVRQGHLDQERANRLFEEEREAMKRHEERRLKVKTHPFG